MHRHAPYEAAGRRISVATYAFAARRWWPIAVSAALLGGALGLGATSHPSSDATLLVRVLSLAPDGQGFENNGQTALRLMQTDEVFRRAAEIVGADTAALRARTAITQVTQTDLLEIDVSGKSADQPAREATAIATAARELMEDLSKDQVAQEALSSNVAVVSGVLPNGAAELARQQELGKSAATRQDIGLSTALTLSAVGNPQLTATGLPRSIAAAVGILVGALLGLAGACIYGRRFGRLRRPGDVRTALPRAGVIEGGRLAGVAHRYSDVSNSLISLLALRGAHNALPELTTTLDDELRADGRRPYVLQTSDVKRPAAAVSDVGWTTDEAVPHTSNGTKPTEAVGEAKRDTEDALFDTATEMKRAVSVADAGPTIDVAAQDDVAASDDSAAMTPEAAATEADREIAAAQLRVNNGKPRLRPSPRPRPTVALDVNDEPAAPAARHPIAVVEHEPAAMSAPELPPLSECEPLPVAEAVVSTNGHRATAPFIPAIGRGRDRDLAVLGRDALVVSGGWEPQVAARLADRADLVLLVAKKGVTRLRDLTKAGRELGDTDVVVVLT